MSLKGLSANREPVTARGEQRQQAAARGITAAHGYASWPFCDSCNFPFSYL